MVAFSDFLFYPDYYGLFYKLAFELPTYYKEEPVHEDGFLGEVRTYCQWEWTDLTLLVLLAFCWTVFRWFLTKFILKPIANYAQLTDANVKKMPESAWRATFYIISWSFIAYVIVGSHFELFTDPPSVFKGWSPGMKVPSDIYAAYAIQGSFYLHCMFATVFLDVWRSDSALLCAHHVLTLSLIGFSYAARYHNGGMLVLWFHDVCDIFMELAKLCIYFKVRAGKFDIVCERLANVFFIIFVFLWFTCRIYWFPLKVLYSILPSTAKVYYQDHLPFGVEFNAMLWLLFAMDVYWFSLVRGIVALGETCFWFPLKVLYSILPSTTNVYYQDHLPFGVEFNIMLWLLYAMDVYWFLLILVFLYKIITGQSDEMDDPREESDENSLKAGIEKKRHESMSSNHEDEKPVQNTNGVITPGNGALNGNGVKHRQPHQPQNNSHEVPNHN